MDFSEQLSKLTATFSHYYTIKKENIEPPFVLEAQFSIHTEQYMFVRSAKLAVIDSNDYVYFATQENLDISLLNDLCNTAWQRGLQKVKPFNGHKNSDVTLIILTQNVLEKAPTAIKKLKLTKNYKLGFWGWSNFRIAVVELNKKEVYCNRHGKDLKKVCSVCL